MATLVYKADTEFDDGSRYEMRAWRVPESEDYPDGIRYRFQYMTADGTTLLRYDNSHYREGVGMHHRHTSDGVESLEYNGLAALIRQFKQEVADQ